MEVYQVANKALSLPQTASSYRKLHKAHFLLTTALEKVKEGLIDDVTKEDLEYWVGVAKYCLDAMKTLEQLGMTDLI